MREKLLSVFSPYLVTFSVIALSVCANAAGFYDTLWVQSVSAMNWVPYKNVDAAGNTYVLGTRSDQSYARIKIDACGNNVADWRYPRPPFESGDIPVAVPDTSGEFVCLVCKGVRKSSGPLEIRKYREDGTLLWSTTWTPPIAFEKTRAWETFIDARRNIVFSAHVETSSSYAVYVVKYSGDGTFLWNNPVPFGSPQDIQLDTAGNIYVSTSKRIGLSYDWAPYLEKFAPDGTTLYFIDKVTDTIGSENQCPKLFVDNSGSAYWLRDKRGGTFLEKYDAEGSLHFSKFTPDSVAHSFPEALSGDLLARNSEPSGTIYALFSRNNNAVPYLKAINTSGSDQWSVQLPDASFDLLSSLQHWPLEVSSDGIAIVRGTEGNIALPPTIAVNRMGQIIWDDFYSSQVRVWPPACDNVGNIYTLNSAITTIIKLGHNSSHVTLDSIVVQGSSSVRTAYSPDSVPMIELGSGVTVFGRATDTQSTNRQSSIEVFDGLRYSKNQADSGLVDLTTGPSGLFSYVLDTSMLPPPIDESYAFWFAMDSSAIPLIVSFAGQCTGVDCLVDSISRVLTEMVDIPDSSVVAIISDSSSLSLRIPSCPKNQCNLLSHENDVFFEAYANVYSGILERNFLADSTTGWLPRGLSLCMDRASMVARELHKDVTDQSKKKVALLMLKSQSEWARYDPAELPEFKLSDVDWLSVSLTGLVCGFSGGAACVPFAITLWKELLNQTAVPIFCDDVIHTSHPELCRDLGKLALGAAAIVVSPASRELGPMRAYYKVSKNPWKKLRWALELANKHRGYIKKRKIILDAASVGIYYGTLVDPNRISAIGLRGVKFIPDEVGPFKDVPLEIIATSRSAPPIEVSEEFVDPSNPIAINITASPLWGLREPGTLSPAAPAVEFRSQAGTLDYEWSSINHEENTYGLTVPISELPGYTASSPYSFDVELDGFDTFGNHAKQSSPCGFGNCDALGLELTSPGGIGISIPPGAVDHVVPILMSTQPASSLAQPQDFDKNIIDSTVVLSPNALVILPDTFSLEKPAIVRMRVDSAVIAHYVQIGRTISLSQFDKVSRKWITLLSTFDSATSTVTAPTISLGRFVATSAVPFAYVCADANGSGNVTISDAVFLIKYIFSGGQAPIPLRLGDANCTGSVTVSDVVYLVNYVFSGGAQPCAACP